MKPYATPQDAAIALLISGSLRTRQQGSFCGQVAVDRTPLTAAQEDWIGKLLARANLPPLMEGAGQ